ncbi:hypothetical protein P3T76_010737 [Phytophthora citrophthora]|uniref:Uncharacterized protein n=1 Tax=Phytophthora citrophthora TaxID=4793 RepID=A0AAD9LG00_9STRA|nr:hypothetical protein P3T76_010737 [Phytophthora citrophthora]
MYELLLYEHYIRLELLPAYLTTMVLWVLTSSVRGVVWSLVTLAWMVVSVNSSLVVNLVIRYQDVLRDPELNQLAGPSYVFALWNAFFAVPVQVLEEGEAKVKGFCWFVLLVLSLAIHVPMMLFDLLEFVALGTTGLAAVLVMTNSLNQMFELTRWLTPATGVIVVVGIVAHGWRFGQGSGHLGNAAPRIVVKKALKSVRREVSRCNRREAACLASLNGPAVNSTETSRPAATSLKEGCSVSSCQPHAKLL